MKIFNSITSIPPADTGVITIGTFDGLHLGHRKILSKLKTFSKKLCSKSIAITFRYPPIIFLRNLHEKRLLANLDFRLAFFEKKGIDILILIDFSKEFANITHNEFFLTIFKKFNFLKIVVGNNFKFGKENAGDINFLKQQEKIYNNRFSLNSYSQYINGELVSSSKIRNKIAKGDIETANICLRRNFHIDGKIIKGKKLGQEIGFPTINMLNNEYVLPQDGVYATHTELDGKIYKSMTHIGTNEFYKYKRIIETNIFNFNQNIYGKTCKVFFEKKIRNNYRFNNNQELIKQLKQDKKNCLKVPINKI